MNGHTWGGDGEDRAYPENYVLSWSRAHRRASYQTADAFSFPDGDFLRSSCRKLCWFLSFHQLQMQISSSLLAIRGGGVGVSTGRSVGRVTLAVVVVGTAIGVGVVVRPIAGPVSVGVLKIKRETYELE